MLAVLALLALSKAFWIMLKFLAIGGPVLGRQFLGWVALAIVLHFGAKATG